MRAALGVALVAAAVSAASVSTRFLAYSSLLPAPLWIFGWSDVAETWHDAQLAGHHIPYLDVGFAYPPLIGYVAGALSLIVNDARGYLLGWGIVTVASAAVCGLILALAAGPRRALAYWACAPQLFLLAGVNFDVLAALCTAAVAVLARRERVTAALSAAGIGTAVKIFPATFAPILVLRGLRSGSPRPALAGALAFGAVIVALYLPATLAPRSNAPFAAEYLYRVAANPDSIWSIPAELLGAIGIDSDVPILVATTVGLMLTYLLLTLPRAIRAQDPVVGLALAVATVLIWTRLYSPQYAIWLLPFFVLLPFRARTFALLTVADLGVFVGIYSLTLVLAPGADLAPLVRVLLAGSVALRHVALIVFWLEAARMRL